MSLRSDNSQPPLRAAIAAAAGTTVFREPGKRTGRRGQRRLRKEGGKRDEDVIGE